MNTCTTKTNQKHSPFRVGANPMAFGFCDDNELFVEQQRASANYYTPYKFSGKEKDEETSYSYFGARYYMSDISVWASVDPMRDKYPYQSPYTYCGWNPLKIVDPNGTSEEDGVVLTGDENAKKETVDQTNKGLSAGFQVKYDNDGKMGYDGAPSNRKEVDIANAIDDPDVNVYLNCTYDNYVTDPYTGGGVELIGDAFFGNNSVGEGKDVLAFQAYNPEHANIMARNGDVPASELSAHAIIEAFKGGLDNKNINLGSSQTEYNDAYNDSHRKAASSSGLFRMHDVSSTHLRNNNDPKGTMYIKGQLIDIHGQNKKSKN